MNNAVPRTMLLKVQKGLPVLDRRNFFLILEFDNTILT
ncbi:hypothetical protein NIES2100_25680 [Calothrix sp. NIES-2100]|nr:hypothetical protein NIES2100_25680 [Calothrix sp. NIES-2100]